ncbi:MBL fold metallo-hydrolase [Candidatus Dependentiae bacterium]|nr:MBL fold metallo-hydrolase [Candidatus Dependentiae bacterium]
MEVKFWGTRGSLPASITSNQIEMKLNKILELLSEKKSITYSDLKNIISTAQFSVSKAYGTNTSCVQIDDGNKENYIILDAGTGLRDFGNYIMKNTNIKINKTFHIFISHTHWDHIHGFPFFTPAYIPGNKIIIYGVHNELEKNFETQQSQPFFPISLKMMAAEKKFIQLSNKEKYNISGYEISIIEQNHPGKSYGYSFIKNGKKIVYSTDAEHKEEVIGSEFIEFFRNSDLMIFDAQYTLVDSEYIKCDWGHSSNFLAVEFASLSNTKHLVMFHSEPSREDFELDKILGDTKKYAQHFIKNNNLKISQAYDSMLIEI